MKEKVDLFPFGRFKQLKDRAVKLFEDKAYLYDRTYELDLAIAFGYIYQELPKYEAYFISYNGELGMFDSVNGIKDKERDVLKTIEFMETYREYSFLTSNILNISFLLTDYGILYVEIKNANNSNSDISDKLKGYGERNSTFYIRGIFPSVKKANKALDFLKATLETKHYNLISNNGFYIATIASRCIVCRNFSLETTPSRTIEENYNDDIPYKKIIEIIKEDRESLILFYGTPGTGKTTIVKYLIMEPSLKETPFIFMDSNLLNSLSNEQLLDFLLSNKKSVIVLEDCEKLLMDRKQSGNPQINTLLNLTDGIIGEALGINFICTFNCELSKIDKALLRKGRLSLKYEFKELSLEKTKKLLPNATKPMTLADIYNFENENDFSKSGNGRIGFN